MWFHNWVRLPDEDLGCGMGGSDMGEFRKCRNCGRQEFRSKDRGLTKNWRKDYNVE